MKPKWLNRWMIKVVDFRNADLRGRDFGGADMRFVKAHRILFEGMHFDNAQGHDAVFAHTDLQGSDFTGANLSSSVLPQGTLTRNLRVGTKTIVINGKERQIDVFVRPEEVRAFIDQHTAHPEYYAVAKPPVPPAAKPPRRAPKKA